MTNLLTASAEPALIVGHRLDFGTFGTADGTHTMTISIVQNDDKPAVIRQELRTPGDNSTIDLAPVSARKLAVLTLKMFGLDESGPLGLSGALTAVQIAAALVAAADMIDGASA